MFYNYSFLNIMSRLFSSILTATAVLSCAAAGNDNYNVNVNFTPDEDGLMLYMVNYDNGAKIDSAVVANGKAEMKGFVGTPLMAQLVLDGSRAGSFILEPGTTTVDVSTRTIKATGNLTQKWDAFNGELQSIAAKYQEIIQSEDADKGSKLEALESRYNATTDSMFNANADNMIGYRLFLDRAYELTPEEFEAALVEHPKMAEFNRVKKLRSSKANEAATSVGQKFKDFAIENGTTIQRLSDYVGNGKWTLVDFWASWCGPCIRETETIKALYNKYSNKGLEFLGVAVWDEPANTLKAIEEHSLPWKQIINAQSIPTDLYGIAGIPCIILFDPEGNIVSRGKQGESLVEEVEKAMSTTVE